MAEHTSSSITIDAAPADVMGVISDFARYPEWTGEVKEAEVLATDAQGRAEQVRLVLDAGAIKDDHTLAYTWHGDDEVSWTLVKSQMLRAIDGSYSLAPVGGGDRTEVTYRLTVVRGRSRGRGAARRPGRRALLRAGLRLPHRQVP
ncbi:SRPBCC family protein, partial [Streptomyces zhihengii]|uniref:SRPBCC family protein n=1 Tax=Streptomyces zhihengii TaxID=1818004 RepID=UPI003456C415